MVLRQARMDCRIQTQKLVEDRSRC
jgi:hypothetical protein